MKNKILYLFLALILLSAVPNAQAGFAIKKNTASAAHTVSAVKESGMTVTNGLTATAKATASYMPLDRWANRGWIGIVSVICGALGFLFPFFAFAAVLLGFIGMGRRRNRNTGVAIAGFVLGMAVVLLVVFGSFTGFGLY